MHGYGLDTGWLGCTDDIEGLGSDVLGNISPTRCEKRT